MNFLKYSLLRIGLMVSVFFLCLWLKVGLVLAGIFAVLIAFAVSYLAFPRLHVAAGQDMQRFFSRRSRNKPITKTALEEDADIEDEYAENKRRQEGFDF